jgi:6-phosphogluconolactonase (cycloisomerase 2 family)
MLKHSLKYGRLPTEVQLNGGTAPAYPSPASTRDLVEETPVLPRVTTVNPRRPALGTILALAGTLLGALLMPALASASQVYVASGEGVSPFSIGANGALVPIACSGTNCEAGSSVHSVAVAPNGKFLYTTNYPNSVSPFSIQAGGALAPIACSGANCATGFQPLWLAISPNGRFLYASDNTSGEISPFAIQANGSLLPIPCASGACVTEEEPQGVAVSPNGKFLYVANFHGEYISVFAIEANGTLSRIPCPESHCKTGRNAAAIAISPNGRFLYAINSESSEVLPFSIETNGTLSPIACTGERCKTGNESADIAVSPNGRWLYVTNRAGAALSPFVIEANGSLNQIACLPGNCEGPGNATGIAVSPNSGLVYVTTAGADLVSPFSVEASGALAPIACTAPDCETKSSAFYQSVAISPDQAPTAAFTATPAANGSATSFNGSASTAYAGQTVATYEWNFGDGTTVASGGPTPTHVYAKPGTYTVTLTVTDNAGCSTQLIFTGQTASCNGSSGASASQVVVVPAAPVAAPVISGLRQSAKTWREGNALATISAKGKARGKNKPPVGTTFSFSLSEAASVVFTFTQPGSGRKVAKKCVAQTNKNAKAHRCKRTVVVAMLALGGRAGADEVRFGGRISKHTKLKPGTYTVSVTATAAGKHSTASTLRFTIAKS